MTVRDRRALLLGSVVVVAAVLLLRVLPWGVRQVATSLSDLRERAALLGHERVEVGATAILKDSTAGVSQALVGLASKLLSGPSSPEAMADLSGRINLAATRNQAKVERLDPLPDSSQAGRMHRARLHVAMQTDVRGLAGFLHAVETADAVLTVEDLRVVAPDPGSADRVSEVLEVEVTVAGWYVEARETGHEKRETDR